MSSAEADDRMFLVDYFREDSSRLGLTASPRNEIDRLFYARTIRPHEKREVR